ncbi:MAG: phosphotransferase, partial [Nitrospira sp.]
MSTAHSVASRTPLVPPDRRLIARTIETRFSPSLALREVIPLAGDASNRRYFRATLTGGLPHSVIVMQLAEPEGFKQSEEAVSGTAHQIAELPFINIRSHLARVKVPVPALHYYDQSAGLLYLEDFGDVTLADAVSRADQAQVESYYRQAIDVLVEMQIHATKEDDHTCLAFHRGFDAPLLMW